MKLLSWNIRHGGGRRTDAIIAAIAEHRPEAVVLEEFRGAPSAKIRSGLHALGWQYGEWTEPPRSVNGVCILSRSPLRRLPVASGEHAARWLDVEMPEFGIALAALHIVTASARAGEQRGEAKTRFWEAVLAAAERRGREPFLFIGDFNTGLPYRDEGGCTFHCAEQFARLAAAGWVDAWRYFHAERKEYSWYSRSGNGFRIDHAFAAPALLPRVQACRYSHGEREAGISDHSPLIVELD